MSETIAIIDFGAGNLRSVSKAFERMSYETSGAMVHVTDNPDILVKADRIVCPGVGSFADCRASLDAAPGIMQAINHRVIKEGAPFFGICVGMQLMSETGMEHGATQGLGWIDGSVSRIKPSDPKFKVPHMGWNSLSVTKPHPVLANLDPDAHVYFTHSFSMKTSCILATTDHGDTITAAVGRNNLFGAQFHPEKSQQVGLHIIGNFLNWKP